MTTTTGEAGKTTVARPGRLVAGCLLLGSLLLLISMDLLVSSPIDPYLAPWPTALGSGSAPSGALCTDLSGLLP